MTSLLAPGHAPLYRQLATRLREQIATGVINTGDALPSERDLCEKTGASRVTVRKAIELLIGEGLLSRRQGSGTYVSQRIRAPGSYLSSFSADAEARGDSIGTIWVSKYVDTPTNNEIAALELSAGARVARLSRVRMAGGEPLAIENAVVPLEMLPDLGVLGSSLYAALDSCANRPVSGQQTIRAALASASEAALLSIAKTSEVLRIERITRRADGRPVELTRSTYRGDRYEFVSELRGSFGAP